MREKLIELLNNITSTQYEGDKIIVSEMDIDDNDINRITDYLLANGVIVLTDKNVKETPFTDLLTRVLKRKGFLPCDLSVNAINILIYQNKVMHELQDENFELRLMCNKIYGSITNETN